MSTPVLETVPVIPARRSHSLDIIDVDLLDDEEIATFQRPLQRRRHDAIDIEEIIELPGPQSGRSSPRYRSPPPPRHTSTIPPVPSVPRHLRGMTSLPTRRRASRFSPPGVVRPSSRAFAFEADFGDAQRVPTPLPETSAGASAPSHHVPVMGFGGALLAVNARNNRDTNRHATNRRSGGLPHRIRHIPALAQATDYLASSLRLIVDRFHGDNGLFAVEGEETLEDIGFYNFAALTQRHYSYPSYSTNFAAVAKKTEYKPEFTHPGKMPADFTHDFGSSTDSTTSNDVAMAGTSSTASSSSSSVDTILVCARCFDPLVIGGVSDTSATNRRLWALRCGHILDGKCVEKLMKPDDELEETALFSANDDSSEKWNPSPKDKRNRKEVALPPVQAADEASRSVPRVERRRLRSGRALPPVDQFIPPHHERPSRQKKGKAKMQAPVVEREHDWQCPISGCSKVHRSVLIGGRWKMDEKSGAITMYV